MPSSWPTTWSPGKTLGSVRIRDQVITLIVFPNPDGMTMVADWYMEHVGTPFERSPLPWLYNRYVGHDNNRDSYNVTQEEVRNVSRLQNLEWFPNVVYNHHQTAPFPARIWLPPYGEPTNPNKPGEVIRWENLIGAAMGAGLRRRGEAGGHLPHGLRRVVSGLHDPDRHPPQSPLHPHRDGAELPGHATGVFPGRHSRRSGGTSRSRPSTARHGRGDGGGSETPWTTASPAPWRSWT